MSQPGQNCLNCSGHRMVERKTIPLWVLKMPYQAHYCEQKDCPYNDGKEITNPEGSCGKWWKPKN